MGGDGRCRNSEYGFSFMPQAGWMLQKGETGPGNDPVLIGYRGSNGRRNSLQYYI